MSYVSSSAISHTGRAHCGPEAVTHDPANQAVAIPAPLARAVKFAGRHFADPALRESRVAAEVGVTPQRLAQLFQNSFGITYSVWLARKRVAAAEALLCDSRKRIVDIALTVGFGSVASFNRVFRKHTGMTPGECRSGKKPHDRADAP
jgi:AraC-like DNA-binding protein